MTQSDPPRKISCFFHPWVYFGIFLFAETTLSLLHSGSRLRLGLLALGIGFPLGLDLFLSAPQGHESFFFREAFPSIPAWCLGALFVGGLDIRFYKNALSTWPLFDKGTFAFYAAELSGHWTLSCDAYQSLPLFLAMIGLYGSMAQQGYVHSAWAFGEPSFCRKTRMTLAAGVPLLESCLDERIFWAGLENLRRKPP